jgi:hypothetical protein
MNLFDYLTKHDGKPRPDGPELIRLAAAVGRSTYYLYLTARGHKRVSAETAQAMHEASIGRELDAEAVNKSLSGGG